MNCRPGDLAVIVRCRTAGGAPFLGMVVEVVRPSDWYADHWVTRPEFVNPISGLPIDWQDAHLRPIRDQPGEDEILRIAGLPAHRDSPVEAA